MQFVYFLNLMMISTGIVTARYWFQKLSHDEAQIDEIPDTDDSAEY